MRIDIIQERLSILSKIKDNFLLKEMQRKLLPESTPNYLSMPANVDPSLQITQLQHFVENDLEEFIEKCKQVLPYFSEEDEISIDTGYLTDHARGFLDLITYLSEKGFYTAEQLGQPINFWSGKIAMDKAFDDPNALSAIQIPALAVMIDVTRAIFHITEKQNYDHFTMILTRAFLRVFAQSATGIANVYIDSQKISELPGLTVGGFFWEIELPTLMKLYKAGVVSDIQLHFYDSTHTVWQSPISIFSTEARKLPVYRRHFHPLDFSENKNLFLRDGLSTPEIEAWKISSARPALSYGRLKQIGIFWQEKLRTVDTKCDERSCVKAGHKI